MKKIAIVLFVLVAAVQIVSTVSAGFKAADKVASVSAKRVAMMEEATR